MLRRRKNRLYKHAKQRNTAESWARFRQARDDYVLDVSLAKDHYEQSKYTYLINENNSTKK